MSDPKNDKPALVSETTTQSPQTPSPKTTDQSQQQTTVAQPWWERPGPDVASAQKSYDGWKQIGEQKSNNKSDSKPE